jgi:hypothetical protein
MRATSMLAALLPLAFTPTAFAAVDIEATGRCLGIMEAAADLLARVDNAADPDVRMLAEQLRDADGELLAARMSDPAIDAATMKRILDLSDTVKTEQDVALRQATSQEELETRQQALVDAAVACAAPMTAK